MFRRALAPLAILVAWALVPSGSSPSAQVMAQDPAPQPAVGFDSVNVEVVNVEVYVTDNKGRTVDGLRADDFRLFVDQEPIGVTNFYRAVGSSPASTETVGSVARPEIAQGLERAAETPAAAARGEAMTLAIYVDNLQLTPGGRRSYLMQIREFLDGRLNPGDHLIVVSYDRSLEVEQNFSGSFDELATTLDSLWKAPARALDYEVQFRNVLEQIESILETTPKFDGPCGRADQMHDLAETYGAWVATQVEQSLRGLEHMVQALSSTDGRKAVLYLSNGLHQNPGADVHLMVNELCEGRTPQMVSNELTSRLVDRTFALTRLANTYNVTFYTLDATGLQSNSSAGMASGHQVIINGQSFDLRPSSRVDSRQRDSRQGTLFTLAHETGGLAILNANRIDVDLGKIEDSLRRYYSLGFAPPEGREAGTNHIVRVELEPARKGYQLHYRRSYVDQAPADRTAGRLMSSLLLGYEDNPLGVSIAIGRAQVGEGGLPTVALRIGLPLAALGWLEQGDHRTGEVELFIAVQDGDGQHVDMRHKSIPLHIKESLWAEAAASTHTLEIALPVPSTDARLAFAVADRVGSRTSYLSPSTDGS